MSRTFPILAYALILLGCFRAEVIQSKHNSTAAAQDTIARGWIPNCLPPGASNIKETHNLDLNTGEGSFSFTESDVDPLRSKLTPYKTDQSLRIHTNRDRHEKRGTISTPSKTSISPSTGKPATPTSGWPANKCRQLFPFANRILACYSTTAKSSTADGSNSVANPL